MILNETKAFLNIRSSLARWGRLQEGAASGRGSVRALLLPPERPLLEMRIIRVRETNQGDRRDESMIEKGMSSETGRINQRKEERSRTRRA